MDTLQKLGLTPIYVRLAAKFLEKGTGEHPCNALGYDRVHVSVQRGWNNYAFDDEPPAYFMEFRVEFFTDGVRQKWVEFKTSMIGGGSKQPGFQVHTSEDDDDDT